MSLGIVDLSSMIHRLWHVDKDNVTHKIVSFLKTLPQEHVIVAVDCPPYKRKEVYPEYKANRDVPDPELIGCIKNTQNKVYTEGFKIAKSEGWEADDVIATIISDLQDKGLYNVQEIVVYGSDKDLLQITPITDPFDKILKGAEDRLQVKEEQVVDYLALIGDASDNIKGVPGVGPKTAVSLLQTFGSIDGIYKAIDETPEKFTKPAIFKSLQESKVIVYEAMKIIALNCAVEIEYLQKEVSKDVAPEDVISLDTEVVKEVKTEQAINKPERKEEQTTAITVRTEPLEYRKSLEPIGIQEAWKIANTFDRSGLYPKFKGPEQVLMAIMRGRELGFGATSSLDLIQMIQGKPTMGAAGLLGKVMSHKDICEYIYCSEMTDTACTWITKRVGHPNEVSCTFTLDDAIKLEYIIPEGVIILDKYGKKKESKDNWLKQRKVMLQWRACLQLVRQVYPDLINGLYSTEEMQDV